MSIISQQHRKNTVAVEKQICYVKVLPKHQLSLTVKISTSRSFNLKQNWFGNNAVVVLIFA